MAKKLENQKYELILAHILNPQESPLPAEQHEQLERVMTAARLLDRHPEQAHIVSKLQAKFRIGRNTAYADIRFARELFVMNNPMDWDFWHAWQIQDLCELIRECKMQGRYKEWQKAHETLHKIIGERPVQEEDPRRMEKNNIFIQLNDNSKTINLPIDVVSKLSKQDLKTISDATFQDISEEDAADLMES